MQLRRPHLTLGGVGDQVVGVAARHPVHDVLAVRAAGGVHLGQIPRILVRLAAGHEPGVQQHPGAAAAEDLVHHVHIGADALDHAVQRGPVLVEQIGGGPQQIQRGHQRLLVVAQDRRGGVGQADEIHEHGIEVVFLVDEGAAGDADIVGGAQQIRHGVGVEVGHPDRRPQIALQIRQARIDVAQELIAVGQQLPQLVAAALQRCAERGQRRVQFLRLHLGQHVGQMLEQRIEFDRDGLGGQCRARLQGIRRGLFGHFEIHVFGAEHGGGSDVHTGIGGDQFQLVGVHVQPQPGVIIGVGNRRDPADFDAADLHLRIRVQHQPGARRVDVNGAGVGESTGEHRQRDGHDGRQTQHEGQPGEFHAPAYAEYPSGAVLFDQFVCRHTAYPERWKLPEVP